jgi:hypothetical protein
MEVARMGQRGRYAGYCPVHYGPQTAEFLDRGTHRVV